MKLDEVIPYIKDINDVDVAKTLLELEAHPDGYYSEIYKRVNILLKHNVREDILKNVFLEYEENMAIKYVQHLASIYDEIKSDKMHSLFHKKTFLNAILDIKDIYTLRLYLTKLNNKFKDVDIDYKIYVPEYKSII